MDVKVLTRRQWRGSDVDSRGKATAPVAAPSVDRHLEGLNPGEIYICDNPSDPCIFILTTDNKVVKLSGTDIDELKSLFISKVDDDVAEGSIEFKKDIHVDGTIVPRSDVRTDSFSSGELGSGYRIGKYAGTSDTYLEIDRILVRKMAQFVELAIKRLSHVGGSIVVSSAELTISKVEEQTSTYRCYIDTTDGNTTVKLDEWSVGDLARCQTFNLNTNTYYWRAVTSVDSTNGYIELSKTDCDSGSGVPKRGDVLVALGNKTDSTRQNAIVLASTGTSAPSIKVYHGISSYSLTDKDATSIEYDADKGRMSLNVYGDMYIGNRDESNYIKYDQDEGIKMRVSEFSVKVTDEDGEESYQELDEIVKKVSQQTDGYFLVWRSSTDDVPSATIEPEKDWTTDAMKSEHIGDIYLNSDGLCWEYTHIENVGYYWTAVSDAYLISALNKVNSKARCFVGVYGTDTPTSGDYTKNDMWVNATYGTTYNKEMLVCIKNGSWDSFKISDWALANAYSATLSNFISNTYNQFISDIQQQVDGKAESWSQSTDPSVAWTTDALKASHVGDIWYDTTNNVSKIWNGSSWDTSDVDLSGLTDDIDGKASIYVGATPNTPYKANDLWILPTNKTVNNTAYKKGSILISSSDSDSYVQSHWTEKVRYTDDSALTNFINNTYNVFVEEINSQIDGKAESYFQSADPADSWTNAHSEHKGDVWVKLDPDDNSYMASYIYDGTQWIEQTINLDPLVDKVDGKASIYVSQPEKYEARDLWILSAQTTVNGKVYEKGTILISSEKSTTYDPTHWSKKDCYTNGMNATEKTNLLETGIDISNKKITLTANTTKIQSTDGTQIAMFSVENNKPYLKTELIKADEIVSKKLSTSANGVRCEISGSTMSFFGINSNTKPNIKFGLDDDGNAVLQFFNTEGNMLYDLGPNGLRQIQNREAKWTSYTWIIVDSVFTSQSVSSTFKAISETTTANQQTIHKYTSPISVGVNQDSVNDGRFFGSEIVNDSNYVNGYYTSKNQPVLYLNPNRWEQYLTDHTLDIGEVAVLDDAPSWNTITCNTAKSVYRRGVTEIVNGQIVNSYNIYWLTNYNEETDTDDNCEY